MPTPTKNINAEKIQGNLSITSVSATTISAATYYNSPVTTGVTISNGVVAFNRVDSQSAYTVTYSGVNLSVVSDNVNKVITFSATTGPQSNKIYVDSTYGADVVGNGDVTKPFLTVEYALSNTTNTGLFTGGTTNTTTTISGISDTHNAILKVGQYVTGAGIPFGTIIVAKGNQGLNVNTITISKPATATASNVSLTWWTVYEVILSGIFNATSNWTKQGMYVNSGNATIYFGNLSLFDGTTVFVIPHKILGRGSFFGTHVSSRFINLSGTQNIGFNFYASFGSIETISTVYAITTSFGTNENYVQIEGGFINARFGFVATINGFSHRISFDSYGLLGGIVMANGTTSTTAAINTISGAHTTPAAITVLNSGNYANSTGSYNGSTNWSSYSVHKGGKLNGNTHTIANSNIEFNNWSSGSLTINGSSVLTFTSGWGGNITIASTATLFLYGNCGNVTLTIPAGSTAINYGTLSGVDSGISGAGKFINNGVFTSNTIKFAGTIENYGNITANDIEFTGNNWAVTNFGQIYLSAYGIMMQTYTGKFINRGRIESVGAFTNNTAMILLNQTGATFENYGEIISNDTDITDALITKTAGILKLFPGSRLKVSNTKSPIRCTTTGSTSRDIYMFNCITNCDGSTYGLGFAFDGSSYVPNDLVGGTKYENINY